MINPLLPVSWLLATAIISPTSPSIQPDRPQVDDEQQTSAPIVRVYYNYYPISGSTVSNLQSQMSDFGPLSELEQRNYAAEVVWHVQWSYDYAMSDRGCAVTNAVSTVDVTVTLPQWDSPPDASPSLIAAWNQFLAALHVHENGHLEHGVAAGTDVLSLLEQFPTYSSCDDLRAAVSSETRQIIQYYNQQDIEYDHETQHGLTQGAVFPPSRPNASQE